MHGIPYHHAVPFVNNKQCVGISNALATKGVARFPVDIADAKT
jgi:hypothetical protein